MPGSFDALEDRTTGFDRIEAEVEAITDPAQRAHARSGLALMRAGAAAVAGQDWIPLLGAVYDEVVLFVDNRWRMAFVVRHWVVHIGVLALVISAVLLIAQVAGLWTLGLLWPSGHQQLAFLATDHIARCSLSGERIPVRCPSRER